jgi:hypothetical protein
LASNLAIIPNALAKRSMVFKSTVSTPRSLSLWNRSLFPMMENVAPASAVDVLCFAARHGAARKTPINCKPGFAHRLGDCRFHLIVGGLQIVAWPVSGANIRTKMNPSFRGRYEPGPTIDEGIKPLVTQLVAA